MWSHGEHGRYGLVEGMEGMEGMEGTNNPTSVSPNDTLHRLTLCAGGAQGFAETTITALQVTTGAHAVTAAIR